MSRSYVKKTDRTDLGRPKKVINQTEFEKLCALQCTQEEIADWFDVCEETLNTWCKENYQDTFFRTYKKLQSTGKISLRRYQYKLAENNTAMAIWLGKQWLNQTDKIETEVNTKVQVVNDVPTVEELEEENNG